MRVGFGDIVFDGEGRRVTRRGMPVHLEPKAFELLALLVERRPAAVSKQDIHDRLWPSTFVSESSLTTLAKQLRDALGDGHVRTVRGFGYAFDPDDPCAGKGTCRYLVWNDRRLPLRAGENLVGRESDADVVVDAPGVSRRHAVVHVRDGEGAVEIEDLGSKNGTFVRGYRIEGRATLSDGDSLWFGHTVLAYRCHGPSEPTLTETSSAPEARRSG